MLCRGFVPLVFVLLLSLPGYSQGDSIRTYELGKGLFRANCSGCHSVYTEIIGPGLGSIPKKRPKAWLMRFIRNSQEVIHSDDEYAKVLYENFSGQSMPSFSKLTDHEINAILLFIESASLRPTQKISNDELVLRTASQEVLHGRVLFQAQCETCHAIHWEDDDEGPTLASVPRRHTKEWLHHFIHNSKKVIDSGDPYAKQLFAAFDKRPMVTMEFLSDKEIDDLLAYIEFESKERGSAANTTSDSGKRISNSAQSQNDFNPVITSLIVITVVLFGLCSCIIFRIFRLLRRLTSLSGT